VMKNSRIQKMKLISLFQQRATKLAVKIIHAVMIELLTSKRLWRLNLILIISKNSPSKYRCQNQ
jgi:hypothetical protein